MAAKGVGHQRLRAITGRVGSWVVATAIGAAGAARRSPLPDREGALGRGAPALAAILSGFATKLMVPPKIALVKL